MKQMQFMNWMTCASENHVEIFYDVFDCFSSAFFKYHQIMNSKMVMKIQISSSLSTLFEVLNLNTVFHILW